MKGIMIRVAKRLAIMALCIGISLLITYLTGNRWYFIMF